MRRQRPVLFARVMKMSGYFQPLEITSICADSNPEPSATDLQCFTRATGRPGVAPIRTTILIRVGRKSRNSRDSDKSTIGPWFGPIRGSRLPFVHVCDATVQDTYTTEESLHTGRAERLPPGEGGIDIRGILRHMPPGIPVALEVPMTAMSAAQGAKPPLVAISLSTKRLPSRPLDSGAKRNVLKRSGFERPFQARQSRLGMAS
jgi:hypothetical protein